MTAERVAVRRFSALVATVAWFGVLLQLNLTLRLSLGNGKTIGEGMIVFFGYFTVLTNILVALVFTVPHVAPATALGRFFVRPGVRTATAAAIALIGLAYFFLLRTIWNPQGWQLVADSVLHYVTPVLYLLFWWAAVPKPGLRWPHVAVWMSYPFGYFAFMLIRGQLTGNYPYHFLDAGAIGYARTLANALGVLLAFAVLSVLLLVAGRLQKTFTSAQEREGSLHV